MQPQPGDLAFIRPGDPLGHLIARLTGPPHLYSHVRVVVAPGWVIEAVPPRVRLATLDGPAWLVRPPYGSADEVRAAVGRACALKDEYYSYLSYLSDVFAMIRFPLEVGWRGSVNCAQVGARAVGMGLDQDDLSPNSMYLKLCALPGTQEGLMLWPSVP